jgi:hypothetical protein
VALRHLSLISGDETVPAVAKLLRNAELQEEAVFCLERIPGKAATQALMTALPGVSDSFKPRVLAALGHLRAEEAVDLCARAMASPNVEVSLAGMKAMARIGKKPSGELKLPNVRSLSDWQKSEYADSILRYAEAQIERGNAAEAVRVYKEEVLAQPQEHLQCAALIGLGKANTAEAAAVIFTKLHDSNRTVRITASKVWAAMAKNS